MNTQTKINIANYFTHNFWLVIENWQAQFRAHRAHRRTRKQIRRHGKELSMRKKEADEMHKATKKTYYVLPDYNGVLRVLDKANIKNLKRAKIMSKEVTCVDLLTESEYNTMNNHFVVLQSWGDNEKSWSFFRGTILECIDRFKQYNADEVQILGGFERVVTIKDGKVIKH